VIAAAILYMALENIVVVARLDEDREAGAGVAFCWARDRLWMIAFAIGMVQGLGISFAFRESIQFEG
jgi:hypothetical protein